MEKISLPPIFCPICGTPADTFKSEGRLPKRLCPQCSSLERHRVFMDLYKSGVFEKGLFNKKRVLRISPSNAEKVIFRKVLKMKEKTVDIRPHKNTDIVADISNMPQVGTGTYDLIFACHVFSYVEPFQEAVAELFRVLKPGGAILCSDFLTLGRKTTELTDMSK